MIPTGKRGTEEQFNNIVAMLGQNTKNYEEKKLKHNQWVEQSESILSQNGWTKDEFYKELNARVGIQTNETRKKKISAAPISKPKKK